MAKFLTILDAKCIEDGVWKIDSPLIYESDIVGIGTISVPNGFLTDFASVPRIPIIYSLYGDRAHYESVLHDYLYRIDSIPQATRSQADDVFFEAMGVRGKGWFVQYGMYDGVRLGGWVAYHKKKVNDPI